MTDLSQSQCRRPVFRLGLIINSYAGLGGPAGLKGSDGVAAQALARGAELRAPQRAQRALQLLTAQPVKIFCFDGEMGADVARAAGFEPEIVGRAASQPSTADDTIAAARALVDAGVDLILFVGGDGTARNMVQAVGQHQPVLGLPSGVKMHSGVYAVVPEAAAKIIEQMIQGELVTLELAEVRDIDEQAFREGRVQSRYYGELSVPAAPRYVQAVKQGGREVEALVLDDLAAEITELMEPGSLYIFGPGSTTFAITESLGLSATLLGVDLVLDHQLVGTDLSAPELEQAVFAHPGPVRLILTAIGGQGHVLGRGNQQLRPALLRQIGKDNLWLVATKAKLENLQGRPLLLDSNDPELDSQWSGFIRVITGYRDAVIYPIGYCQDV